MGHPRRSILFLTEEGIREWKVLVRTVEEGGDSAEPNKAVVEGTRPERRGLGGALSAVRPWNGWPSVWMRLTNRDSRT